MISDRARMSGISLRLAVASIFMTSAALGTTTTSHRINGQIEGLNKDAPSLSPHGNSHGGGQELLMPAILLGAAGEHSLLAWSSWAEDVASSHRTPPALWVVCADTAAFAAFVVQTPYVTPFYVSDESSWATVLQNFLSRKPHVWTVGLLGEGALPHPGLMDSIQSMQVALFEALPSPTAVLTRSRSTGSHSGEERWLSDKFVSQLWCNRAALEASMLTAAGLNALSARDVTLLQMLRRLVRDAVERKMVLVDGTHVIDSFFDAPPAPPASGKGEYHGTSSQHLQTPELMGAGPDLHIGSLDFALVYDCGDIARGKLQEKGQEAAAITTSSIVKAPWPPEYILETVAMNTTAVESKGLVLVSNVNCGYLDMATNFLVTVRNTSDAKVLFVAMDEVSFDFMDALDPGCAVLFHSPSRESRHSVESGRIGDSNFAESVLVRPNILHSILSQEYAALWSDSDMVWLGNPLPLLPRLDSATGADVMLQYDGNTGNKCTCFMFLKPTMMCRMLLRLWEKSIIERREAINQLAFQVPLSDMRNAGLRVDFLSQEVMPAGKHFFDHDYVENYVQLYHKRTQVVHNNWIKGHKDKKRRFQRHHLWFVEDTPFPECGSHSDPGQSWAPDSFDMATSGERVMIMTGIGLSFITFVWYASTSLRARRRRNLNV